MQDLRALMAFESGVSGWISIVFQCFSSIFINFPQISNAFPMVFH